MSSSFFFSLLCALPWSAILVRKNSPLIFEAGASLQRALETVFLAGLILSILVSAVSWYLRRRRSDRYLDTLSLGNLVFPLMAFLQWLTHYRFSTIGYVAWSVVLYVLMTFAMESWIAKRLIENIALHWEKLLTKGKSLSFLCFILLFGLTVIYFSPVFFEQKSISPNGFLYIWPPFRSYVAPGSVPYNIITSDFADSLFPQYQSLRESLLNTGHWPWTNDSTLSTENYATFLGSAFYSIDFLLIYLFGISLGPTLAILVRYLLGGLFCFLFLRLHQVSRAAAVLAAVIFTYSALHVVNLFLPYLFNIPLLFYCTELLIKRRVLLYTAPLILAYVSTLLSGQIVWSIHILTLHALYVFCRLTTLREGWTARMSIILRFGFAALIGVLLLSFLIFPSLEHYRALNLEYRESSARIYQDFKHSLLFLFPSAAGPLNIPNTWGGNSVEYSYYAGLVALLLPLGIFLAGSRWIGAFFVAVTVLVYCITTNSFGILDIVSRLPFYDNSSNTRLRFLWAFTIPAAAGFGMDALLRADHKKHMRILAIFLGSVAVVTVSLLLQQESYTSGDTTIDLTLPTISSHMFWQGFLILISVTAVSLLIVSRNKTLPSLLLIPIVFCDLWKTTSVYVPYLDSALNYPPMRATDFLRSRIDKTARRIMPIDRSFIAHFSMPYDIPSIQPRGFYSLRAKEFLRLIDPGAFAIHPTMYFFDIFNSKLDSPMLDLLNVQFLLLAPGDYGEDFLARLRPYWTQVYNDELLVFENRTRTRAAVLVDSAEVIKDEGAILQRLKEIDPLSTVILEEDTATWSAEQVSSHGRPASRKRVRLKAHEHDRCLFSTANQTASYLVYPRFFHPAWKAYVDGRPTPVYRADYALMAVRVPAGNHEVLFKFEPYLVNFGLGLAFSTGVIALLLFSYLLYKQRGQHLPI